MKKTGKKLLSFIATIAMTSQICLTAVPVTIKAATESIVPATVKAVTASIITDYQPTINEVIDASGFKHPGIGLTKEILENARAEVREQKDPWYSYYKEMSASASASKTVTSSNQSSSDPTKPNKTAYNSQSVEALFTSDGTKAYTQALMYFITGDETYRANAMHIIRIWSQMDPTKYAYYQDACIHAGSPLNHMVTAAEILRYSTYQTASDAWTEQDTANFTDNLINPIIKNFEYSNNWFMNQNNYALVGSIAGFIFTNNREGYNQRVEWFTVNKTAADQGQNGAIKSLFRSVDTNAATGEKLDKPVVENVEMGRDQAHGADDLLISVVIPRMLIAQGTKVDPVAGTVSTKDNAVGPYEFLGDRILTTANYYCQYMLGYETPWVPTPYAISSDGTVRGIYQKLSDDYRGRSQTFYFWDLYYYYTYVKGVNVAEKAPYFYESFVKKNPMTFYYKGALYNSWDSDDECGDSFWLYIPKAAESEGSKYVPKAQTDAALVQIEDRYTAFDNNSATLQEGSTSYVEVKSTAQGSKIALQDLSYADRSKSRLIGLRFRTNGTAKLQLSKDFSSAPYYTLMLPNTNGQWRFITYDMAISHVSYSQLDPDYSLVCMNIIGGGANVDMDYLNVQAGTQLTPPVFKTGNSDSNVHAYVGASVTLDFSATDSSSTDVVSYKIQNAPSDAVLNTSTGAFSWKPTQVGTYSFIVDASDGTTVATKNFNIVVSNDRASSVQSAIASYNKNTTYVTASLNNFQDVYNTTMSQINTASDPTFYQQLTNLKIAVDSLQLLTPLLSDGSMDYTNIVTSNVGDYISNLVDGNNNTYTALTLSPDSAITLDFGSDYKISANAFSMQGRMNFTDRMAGSTVFGSNDGVTWTRLTSGETAFTDGMTTITVDDAYKSSRFRFIKIKKIDPQPDVLAGVKNTFFEPSELRINGQRYETGNKIQSVSLSSDQSVNGKISIGDTAKLTITAKEAINNVKVKIQGVDATISTKDNINWTASVTLNGNVQTGSIKFTVDYQKNDGTNGDTTYLTTDNSHLLLVNRAKLINVSKLATITASADPFGGLTREQAGQLLFDGNTATFGDLGTASGSYYTVDFGDGAAVNLNEIVLMPRLSYSSRFSGLIIQGSNDNVNWTNITNPLTGAQDNTWFGIGADAMLVHNSYRYIRLYNDSAWYGNLAEVEFYGDYIITSPTSVAAGITSVVAPAKDATSLTLPIVPAGYSVAIKSVNPTGVIGTDGAIALPIADTTVAVVLTVTKTADGTKADTTSINVVVPGKTVVPRTVQRLAGVNRIETCIAIAKEQYIDTKPDAVVIATANNFPDALAGSGLAYKYNAPLLLVNKTVSESQSVLDYTTTNLSKGKNIYILGGTGAVSKEISDYLTTKGYKIIRLGGKDRYQTNQKIINYLDITKSTSMVIATGEDFADALSISSIADIKGFPILLNGKDSLSVNVSNYITKLKPTTVYVIGETGVLSTNIETQIKKLNANITIVRLGGDDRYDTSIKIIDYFKLPTTTITVATGINFPDALSGSVLAARKNAGVLLVDNKDVTKQKELLGKEKITNIIIFGGEGVISKNIVTSLIQK